MKKKYPVIDITKTGQNIKRIMRLRGFVVRDIQEFLELSTPQSIYHWFDGRNDKYQKVLVYYEKLNELKAS